jgi:Cytochrome P450
LSVISTVPHTLHKLRRSALNPFFSKGSVAKYAGIIQAAVDQLCVRLEEFYASGNPIDLKVAYSALTVDVISKYSYGNSYDILKKPDFAPDLYRNISSGGELALVLRHYPWILKLASLLPEWLVAMNRNVSNVMIRQKVMRLLAVQILSNGPDLI